MMIYKAIIVGIEFRLAQMKKEPRQNVLIKLIIKMKVL